MPNPRYIGKNDEPTQEMISKLEIAKTVYLGKLEEFCQGQGVPWELENMKNITNVYLIGSHAYEFKWDNDKSDIDIAIVLPDALPEICHLYKRKVLDKILCPNNLEKRRWIDIFSLREDYQVLKPRYLLTQQWNNLDISNVNYEELKR